MNEPANFGTNEGHPWYFDDVDHPYPIKPLFCNFSGTYAKLDNPKYKTHNVYYYGNATAVSHSYSQISFST